MAWFVVSIILLTCGFQIKMEKCLSFFEIKKIIYLALYQKSII